MALTATVGLIVLCALALVGSVGYCIEGAQEALEHREGEPPKS